MAMGKDKLKRFSEIKEFNNVIHPIIKYDFPDHQIKGNWNSEFKNNQPIVLELGCGRGEYTVELARQFSKKNFIGVDIKGARLWRGAKTAFENNITNVRFLRTKVDFIEKLFNKNEVSEIWLTFSDPQPKKPRKRLTSPLFINRYRNTIKKGGIIHLKTDSDLLYEYTLQQIEENSYTLIQNINNIYIDFSKLNDELKTTLAIKTFYEKKWLKINKKIKYISFKID